MHFMLKLLYFFAFVSCETSLSLKKFGILKMKWKRKEEKRETIRTKEIHI
jgi:hypothetical protein